MGVDLQSEHERWLVEKHFNGPVIITDYPASIKAFYMRQNDDGKTVAAMDVLVPGIGEIIGGSHGKSDWIACRPSAPNSTFPRTMCGGTSIPAVSVRLCTAVLAWVLKGW